MPRPRAGSFSRQCRWILSCAWPVTGSNHVPPLTTVTVAGPSTASSFAAASCGCSSHSTESASPSAMSVSFARSLLMNVAIGGQKTTRFGWFAARRASSSATSIRKASPPESAAGVIRKDFGTSS